MIMQSFQWLLLTIVIMVTAGDIVREQPWKYVKRSWQKEWGNSPLAEWQKWKDITNYTDKQIERICSGQIKHLEKQFRAMLENRISNINGSISEQVKIISHKGQDMVGKMAEKVSLLVEMEASKRDKKLEQIDGKLERLKRNMYQMEIKLGQSVPMKASVMEIGQDLAEGDKERLEFNENANHLDQKETTKNVASFAQGKETKLKKSALEKDRKIVEMKQLLEKDVKMVQMANEVLQLNGRVSELQNEVLGLQKAVENIAEVNKKVVKLSGFLEKLAEKTPELDKVGQLIAKKDTPVAFSVHTPTSLTTEHNYQGVVIFQTEVNNHGSHYNLTTGHFTCPTHGLYSFAFNLRSSFFGLELEVELRMNGLKSMWYEKCSEATFNCGASLVLECGFGDQVGLYKASERGEIDEQRGGTWFTGFLIEAL